MIGTRMRMAASGEYSRRLLACLLVLSVALVGAGRVVFASDSIKLLDERDPLDVESVARSVCEISSGREQQISRVSTLDKLADFFEREVTGEGHKLLKCKQQHFEAVRRLQEVLGASKDNVCSETKLALVEDFHNQFVSTHEEHEQSRRDSQRDLAPLVLRLFFMHYAMEMDALCKRNLINNLEWDLRAKFGDDIDRKLFELESERGEEEQAAFGAIFKGAMQKFTDLYEVKRYEDVLMVWDLIENSYLNQKLAAGEESVQEEFDLRTGEPIRLLVKIKTRGYLDKIKRHCHYNFKPIYSKLILPIIRLANLGYSNQGEQFKIELDELKSNAQVKRWYSVTQLCESMLPVKYYEDSGLGTGEVVVISKSEAAELNKLEASANGGDGDGDDDNLKPLEYEPQTNSMEGVDRIESVDSLESQRLVKMIKSNLNAHDRMVGRAVVHLLRNMKAQLKMSRVGRFFFSKKTDTLAHPKSGSHFERTEVGEQLGKTLESMNEQELLQIDGALSSRGSGLGSTRRTSKSKADATGIGARRKYRRKGDVDMIHEMRSDALSYTRTKSWSEIFSGWGEVLSALTPSRTKMVIVASIIIALLVVILMCTMTTAAYAG